MNKYSSKQKNIFILSIFSIVFFILGYLISFIFSDTENSVNEIVYEKISRPQAVPENLETLWEAYNFINDEYYDRSKIDDVKMNDETIKSLIKTLDDKHSTYVSPEKWQITSTDNRGIISRNRCLCRYG